MTQTQAERVIGKFGGRVAMTQTTPYTYAKVRHMERTGFVPSDEFQPMLELAAQLGVDLTPYDFIAHLVVPSRAPVTESVG